MVTTLTSFSLSHVANVSAVLLAQHGGLPVRIVSFEI
jgi:hypothetical protein